MKNINQKLKQLLQREEIRYIFVGMFNVFHKLFWFYILSELFIKTLSLFASEPTLLVYSNILAEAICVVFGFFLACYFTFRVKPTWRRFCEFPIVHFSNLILSSAIIYCLTSWFNLDKMLAQICTWPVTIPIAFLLTRFILKRPHKKTTSM